MEVLSLLHPAHRTGLRSSFKNISPIESARVLSKWCSDLPIELEGDDYIALARKVDAAVRAL
jgi:hypothetical protein